ncbi:hypothetical protein [Anaerocolumna sp. MB42-C2]|uniref:hypothetical protein n=1 Tax=Anaerocolumna sp. MB42-C2 TaxID=3070997 RepID=UPI0027E1E707|nr:hypothetical protein [Anaerocolumna sp. MB42-C2]WMJ87976.1 hypothetical protein RBU59_00260 [Anaerocolumna sp. MB42-C2]
MIHVYSLNGFNIAIDGNSGIIHVLDKLTYEILKDSKELPLLNSVMKKLSHKYDKKDIDEAYHEIEMLIKQGTLLTSEKELEQSVSMKNINKNLKALCLHISFGI